MAKSTELTGVERFFDDDEIIVSKTDEKGRLTYANKVFCDIADYTEAEVIGQPHSLIRHPHMPRCVFKLLWDRIQEGREIFAYVMNRTKHGDHYWVLAHVTPSVSEAGELLGYHSNRRVPNRSALESVIQPLYAELLAEEDRYPDRKKGMLSAYDMLMDELKKRGTGYDEFIASLERDGALKAA